MNMMVNDLNKALTNYIKTLFDEHNDLPRLTQKQLQTPVSFPHKRDKS